MKLPAKRLAMQSAAKIGFQKKRELIPGQKMSKAWYGAAQKLSAKTRQNLRQTRK
jgi:hypothetical protein